MNDKEEAVKRLAEAHYRLEPAITQIFHIQDKAEVELLRSEPIKLLEVNENTIASGIMPLGFDPVPAHGIPYSSVIVEVTPGEFESIQRKELALPQGWTLGPLVPRPDSVNGKG
jgi:hypothetical protein